MPTVQKALPPAKIPATFIKLTLHLFRLELYQHDQVHYSFPIGIGKPQTPTPTGNFKVITKYILDGKGVLGSRWLGFDAPNGPYGIHGTNFPAGIGRQVSNGCVRMHNKDVETLFPVIPIGTTVYIVS